jgi:hypothetical protein
VNQSSLLVIGSLISVALCLFRKLANVVALISGYFERLTHPPLLLLLSSQLHL